MLNNISDITAIILCGGKSKRMGIEKGLLELNGERTIERIFKIVSSIFNKILLITNDPGSYSFLGVPMVGDYFLNNEPLGGIHSGLNKSTTEKNFIISCDMPFISEEAIRYLAEYKTEAEILLPKAEGRIQYLCGIYSKSILADLEKILSREQLTSDSLKKPNLGVKHLIGTSDVEIVNVEGKEFYYKDLFFNMNSPEDYEYVKEKLSHVIIQSKIMNKNEEQD